MTVLILLAALVVLITAAGFGGLAMVVLEIHRIDRPEHQRLTDAACTPADAATRRVLGLGAHIPAHVCEEEQE
jgi:hypothetical protein